LSPGHEFSFAGSFLPLSITGRYRCGSRIFSKGRKMKRDVVLAVCLAFVSSSALALFSAAPDPSIPEPEGFAMIAAGAVTLAALRYLGKRRRNR
jgi:hypothetical protein